MSEINPPLLSTKRIVIATVAALIIGGFLLVAAVLPAEYGIDPTGIGKSIGFNKLYQPVEQAKVSSGPEVAQSAVKVLKLEGGGSEPEVARPEEASRPVPDKQYQEREDSIQIKILAGKGLEYKVKMLKHGRLKYEWLTDRGEMDPKIKTSG